MTERLKYYLYMAMNGDAEAAYKAAHLLGSEGGTKEMIQTQLRRAALKGYVPAQKELALLGLSNELTESGMNIDVASKESKAQGIQWLKKAYLSGDIVATCIWAKFLQYGLYGLCADVDESKRILHSSLPSAKAKDLTSSIIVLALLDIINVDDNFVNCEHSMYADLDKETGC